MSVITIALLCWLYLTALNNRYFYVKMNGEDLIIDKWTREVYIYTWESELSSMEEILQKRRFEDLKKKFQQPDLK